MAFAIVAEVGEDNPKAVVATTILAFSISSIITGLVFFVLGALKLGSLIGFFPRHILVGCIGGVGWFLFVTGIEVSARLDGNLSYTLDTIRALIQPDTLPLWLTPLALAVLLMIIQRRWEHPLIVPLYFMCVPVVFYIVILLIPNLGIADLRRAGWVFEAPEADQPWWHFYTLYGIYPYISPSNVRFPSNKLECTGTSFPCHASLNLLRYPPRSYQCSCSRGFDR
jgi:sulfate permease, SulP family